jgi:hypothetical protein
MKRFPCLILLACGILLFTDPPGLSAVVRASAAGDPGLLCTYAAVMETPEACPAGGPAQIRADYFQRGLLPQQPLPVVPLDPALKELDIWYAQVSKDRRLPLYPTVSDALDNRPHRHLGPGSVWISYIDAIVLDEGTLLMTGDWRDFVWAEDVSRRDLITTQFTGVTVAQIPARPFGWISNYYGVYPSRAPGGERNKTAPYRERYERMQVFDVQTVNGVNWYLIGVNQWIDQYQIGLVYPLTGLPQGVPAGEKWISINLFEQTLAAYEGDRLVFATLTASGIPGWWTRPGLFRIEHKFELDTMQGAVEEDKSDYYYVASVPWVMYFDNTRAIHGEYWHNNLGQPHSHGCVNVPVADAHWLYDWAAEGTPVWVYDPSGKTPTDEASYANDSNV